MNIGQLSSILDNSPCPKCKRFYRNYDDFSLCVNIGEKGYVMVDHENERYTVFYYGIYGSGKLARMFESEYIDLDSKHNQIVNVSEYLNSNTIFEATEDFFLIGFNTNDKNSKWYAELLTSENKTVTGKSVNSYIVCLNGNVMVNGKKFKRYDYAKISPDIEYDLEIDDSGALGLFTKHL
jgi:hypothetical protein